MPLSVFYSPCELEYQFPGPHPMNQERLSIAYDYMKTEPYEFYDVFYPGSDDILRVHSEDYLMALMYADQGREVPLRFSLDTNDMPRFDGMLRAALAITGGTEQATDLVMRNGGIAFHLAGGLHHAQRGNASGFCLLNDAAIAIAKQLEIDPNLKVAYIDIDAHHGDGVEEIFRHDKRVLTCSVHGYGPDFYPGTGEAEFDADFGIFNWPVGGAEGRPAEENELLYERGISSALTLIKDFKPNLIVAQIGTDAYVDDRIPWLNFRATSYYRSIKSIRDTASLLEAPLVCLGGGGYNMKSTPGLWRSAAMILNGDDCMHN